MQGILLYNYWWPLLLLMMETWQKKENKPHIHRLPPTPESHRFQTFKKDTGQSIHFALNWLQHSSLWSHIFFCCHSNAAKGDKEKIIKLAFKTLLHGSIMPLKVNRKLWCATLSSKALGRKKKKKIISKVTYPCLFLNDHSPCYPLLAF